MKLGDTKKVGELGVQRERQAVSGYADSFEMFKKMQIPLKLPIESRLQP